MNDCDSSQMIESVTLLSVMRRINQSINCISSAFEREILKHLLNASERKRIAQSVRCLTSPSQSLQRIVVFLCPNTRGREWHISIELEYIRGKYNILLNANSALKTMNAQHPQQFLCGATKTDGTICQRLFDSTGTRATHRRRARVHQGQIDYDFMCNVCGSGCSTATTLRTHCVRLHPTMSSPPNLTQGNKI
ncbi:hypothetical protein niasHT_034480 [Heterodera trifolii]|uniref:C2H2-type domain-containing protein n=1 Tax=Heterodera trifolii TaxID=157864 RepID=A0ABD2HWL4_9BILA